MVIIKYINLNNIFSLIISLFIMLIYYFIDIPLKKKFLIDVLYSPFFFIILYFIGKIIMSIRILNKIFSNISLISYQMFLIHHILMINLLYFFPMVSTKLNYFCFLFLIIVIIIFFSYLLHFIAFKFIHSKIYIDFENWILNNDMNNNKKKYS